jgi:hypothetical protein
MNESSQLGYAMSKPKKYKGETIYDYVPDYYPTTNVENPVFTRLPPGRKDSRMKDVERELVQYWEILHPMVREYLITIIRYMNEFGEGTEDLDHLKRSLDIEQSNSSELSEENRKLKAQISDLVVEKRALDEKVTDLLDAQPKYTADEYEALTMVVQNATGLSESEIYAKLKKVSEELKENAKLRELDVKREKMEADLQDAKDKFEKTQEEVGLTFQKRLLESQSRIDELEEELEKYKSQFKLNEDD